MTEHKGINLSYLKMLADDHNESGREGTAKDLYVTIDWIKELLAKEGENPFLTIPNYGQYVNTARQEWENPDVEIDPNPRISVSDDGAWVQAWVWVDNYQIGENND